MKYRAAFALALLLVAPGARADSVSHHIERGGWIAFLAYQPHALHSLAQLPAPVRARLEAHLRERLGDAFYSRLRFSEGTAIDRAALLRAEPDAADYQWEVPAYELAFEWPQPLPGLASYTAMITLRTDGSVIEEIALPDFAHAPEKRDLLPRARIDTIAAAQGFVPSRADFGYDATLDGMAWDLESEGADDGVVIEQESLVIDARTGEILDRSSSQAIH